MNKTTIAIGCLVQWYEVDIIGDYIQTLKAALLNYEGEVRVDITLSMNQDLEQTTLDAHEFVALKWNIQNEVQTLPNWNLDVKYDLITIADYRRKFNDKYCDEVDVLVWGESDMLVPLSMFNTIDAIHSGVGNTTPKYIATFGISKMWDSSWTPLEHPKFTVKEHSDSTEDWWGVRYTNTIEDMTSINEGINNGTVAPELVTLDSLKFNGCGLVISSEIIKAGVNIPKSVFFVHEDTAFLHMVHKCLPQTTQYHVKNIYMPHNRKHPKKRAYILGEEGLDKTDMGKLRKSHWWYQLANKFSEENCYNLFNPLYKSKSWKDIFK